jgi:hypothetical protein
MSAEQRDFSDFYLGDNVYELAGGLIPEIAERLEVSIGDEPSSDDLQSIMAKVGPNKVLRDNAEITAIERDEMADMVERSGVQKPLRRSLWTPEIGIDYNIDGIVVLGGVANWQDRMVKLMPELPEYKRVFTLAGNRVMDGPTEKVNPNVQIQKGILGRYPTESEYTRNFISPVLTGQVGRFVVSKSYDTKDGDVIFSEFFEENPGWLTSKLALARVANAGVVMALQIRDAARKISPSYDSDKDDPQVFVATDTFPVSRTEGQDQDPANYQKAATALRQVVLTAKKLHEAEL